MYSGTCVSQLRDVRLSDLIKIKDNNVERGEENVAYCN